MGMTARLGLKLGVVTARMANMPSRNGDDSPLGIETDCNSLELRSMLLWSKWG